LSNGSALDVPERKVSLLLEALSVLRWHSKKRPHTAVLYVHRSALVTGSTSGIGLGIARALASNGANIMLNGFGDRKVIDGLQKQLQAEFNVRVAFDGADLKDAKQSAALVQNTVKSLGSCDIVVNNAGIQHVAPVDSFSSEKWEDILRINLSAVFYTTREALPFMRKQQWGRFVNISSVHGLVASVNKSAYVAAKHGVMGFTKTTALETAGSGPGSSSCVCRTLSHSYRCRHHLQRHQPGLGADSSGPGSDRRPCQGEECKQASPPLRDSVPLFSSRSRPRPTICWARSSRPRSSPLWIRSARFVISCLFPAANCSSLRSAIADHGIPLQRRR
jgi:NADP-dependent 3-hydroxy acid dehydrogenase YdfG